MDEDGKTEVKGKAHCVSSSSDRLRLLWLRLASTSRIILPWRKGGAKAVVCEVSLDGPKRIEQRVSYDMGTDTGEDT
jgi:hypothetical protein